MLEGLGRLVIDLQDIGVRCYTYLGTLKYALEAAAEAGIAVTVADRPIPLGGVVDGPMRSSLEFASFVAPVNVPLCYGMTPGEMATWIVREENLDLDLTIIQVDAWSHLMREPWPNFMPPSPGIKSWDSAVMYPATVFTEAFPALDCDRSGPLAFRILGAPWLNATTLAEQLRGPVSVCGIKLRPYRYTPSSGKYAGQRVNAQTAVVRNGATAGELRELLGLLHGVFHEGLAVLHGLMLDARLSHGDDLIEVRGEDGLHLRQFMGIVGSQYQFHRFRAPLFAAGADTLRRPRPIRAYDNTALSRKSRKDACFQMIPSGISTISSSASRPQRTARKRVRFFGSRSGT